MTEYFFKTSSGEEIPIVIDVRRGLRNMTLRPKTVPRREIRISRPWTTPTASALRFVEQKRKWIENIFDCAPQKVRIQDGDIIEILGKTVKIQHDETKRSNIYLSDKDNPEQMILILGGAVDMMERRLRDFVKMQFLSEVKKIIKTVPREFHPTRLSIKDTSSRWGSRSSTGTISFSWRLAFAPYEVMRYVVMHELAHTKYMDHSVHFWATVSQLYGDGVGRAKLWLSKNGGALHEYF
jgi:predicted metal-dependent hydrolase